MSYEAWCISYQSSEQAARAAYSGWELARKESQFLRSHRPIARMVTELEAKIENLREVVAHWKKPSPYMHSCCSEAVLELCDELSEMLNAEVKVE